MKVNGKDDIPYIMEHKIHVWNHQPNIFILVIPPVQGTWEDPIKSKSRWRCGVLLNAWETRLETASKEGLWPQANNIDMSQKTRAPKCE